MPDEDSDIVRHQFDTDRDSPAVAVAETVAEMEGVPVTELTTIYDAIDDVLDHLFTVPPSPDARVQVEFTYENYRITVEQDGSARFLRLE